MAGEQTSSTCRHAELNRVRKKEMSQAQGRIKKQETCVKISGDTHRHAQRYSESTVLGRLGMEATLFLELALLLHLRHPLVALVGHVVGELRADQNPAP